MIYIGLTVIASVFLLLVFKWFDRFKVNTFYAILVNYLTAAITGILFSKSTFSISQVYTADWLKVALPLGLLFIVIFYLISLTAQKISIATASVANKMSVAMPVLFSVLFLQQHIGPLKWVGIALALASVYLTTKVKHHVGVVSTRSLMWLPLAVFIGSGLIDIAINAANAFYIRSSGDSSLFSVCTFLSAFCFGGLILVMGYWRPSWAITPPLNGRSEIIKALIGGIGLGIPNYFSIYFIFKSLEVNVLSSAELFPLLNVSNVVLAALLGFLLYKEKLSPINLLGILLAVVAILCMAL